jgi:hypothetical protein
MSDNLVLSTANQCPHQALFSLGSPYSDFARDAILICLETQSGVVQILA